MIIIVILLCLALNRFTPMGKWARHYGWLDRYFEYHHKWLGATPFGKGTLGLLMALAPPVVAVAILQWILIYFMWGIAAFVFAAAVLLYALGVMPTLTEDTLTHKANKSNTVEDVVRYEGATVVVAKAKGSVLWQAQTNTFAVLFWFVLLGPAGAVLYRFSRLLSEHTYAEDSLKIRDAAISWVSYLDWIPVRLLGLCFVLAGRFESTFKVWWGQITTTPKNNETYLDACSHAALESGHETPQRQWALYQRALLIFLIILSLLALAAWSH
ncbi:MAG: ampE [Gammaproteobacteria bacterium]|jgi:membrane protein required for beta-lactamase induction|nr:ampE [Gammaproteobacteria bacterium]